MNYREILFRRALFVIVPALAMMWAGGGVAATKTWGGAGTNTLWSNPSNWVGHVAPAPGDDLVFPGTFRSVNWNDFPEGTLFNSILISGYNYAFEGNLITLAGGITNSGGYSATVRLPIRLAASQVFTLSTQYVTMGFQGGLLDLNGFDLTLLGRGEYNISAVIQGNGSLTCTQAVTLTGSNTYTGVTRVLSGTLSVWNERALGDASAGTEVGAGARLAIWGGEIFEEPLRLAAGAHLNAERVSRMVWNAPVILDGPGITFGNYAPMIFNGVLSGAGGISMEMGTVTLNADNTYTGTNRILRGQFTVNGQQPASDVFVGRSFFPGILTGTGRVGRVTCVAGQIQPGDGAPSVLACGGITLDATSLFVAKLNGSASYDRLNVLGTVSLGSAILAVSNSFAASGGEQFMIIDNDGDDAVSGTFGDLPEGEVLLSGGVRFRISYAGGDGNDVVLTALPPPPAPTGVARVWDGGGANNLWTTAENWAGDVTPAPGDDLEFPAGAAQVITANDFPDGTTFHSLRFTGGGYRLEGARIALNAGITARHTTGVNEIATPLYLNTNQTFTSTSAPLRILSAIETAGSTLSVEHEGEVQIEGVISGYGGIAKRHSGRLALSAANTYAGVTEVIGGQLSVRNALALGGLKFGTLVHSNATLVMHTDVSGEPLTLEGRVRSVDSTGTGTNRITGRVIVPFARNADLQVSNVLEIAGSITGSGGFRKGGAGTLLFSGNASFHAGTWLSNGTVAVSGFYTSTVNIFNGVVGGTGSIRTLYTVERFDSTNQIITPAFDATGVLTIGEIDISWSQLAGRAAKLRMQLNGREPGSGYDQLRIEQVVYIDQAHLEVSLGFTPSVGDRFVIIDNIPSVIVFGKFAGLDEGTVFEAGGSQFRISYFGGDGNDVELTVTEGGPITRVWDGGGTNSLWSTRENWMGDVVPSAGNILVFPRFAQRPLNTNDLAPTTPFHSIVIQSNTFYRLYGGPILLSSGIFAHSSATIGLPVTLATNCTFASDLTSPAPTVESLELLGGIDCAGHDLTLSGSGLIWVRGKIQNGNLIKDGSGAAQLFTNNLHGATRVVSGTLALGDNGALGSPQIPTEVLREGRLILSRSNLTIDEPLLLSGTLGTTGALSNRWAGDIQLQGERASLDCQNRLEITGVISGPAELLKTGGGLVVLTRDNSYTGATVLSNGVLLVNGSQPQSPVVLRGGVGGGTGRIGDVIGTNGLPTINPGLPAAQGVSDIGTLACGNLSAYRGVNLAFAVNGTAPGTEHDQLSVNGAITLNDCRLSLTWRFVPQVGDSFLLISNDGTEPVIGAFSGLPEGAFLAQSNMLFRISYAGGDGNDVTLTRIAAPPSTLTSVSSQNGSARLQAIGVSDLTYTVQAASNLNPPIAWQTIGSNVAGRSNIFIFFDTNNPAPSMRFYRLLSP